MDGLKGYAKAIAGGCVAAATWFATAYEDGDIEDGEWAILPISVLVGAGVVAAVRNSP